MSRQARFALLTAALLAGASHGQDLPENPFAPAEAPKAGAQWALIICGIPGDAEHHELYSASIESLHQSLTQRLGFAGEKIRLQFGAEPNDEDGPVVAAARGKATRSELAKELDELSKLVKPADSLWVFVMGHAHYDGRRSSLNLPGAGAGETDIHQDDFGKLFTKIPAHQQVFLITTPVSGFFIRPLSGPGRIVITATEADREVNETLFHQGLTEVLAEPPGMDGFDVDKDGKKTLFDLYILVAQNIARRYASDTLLSTEHALLDDNGDGRGTELQLDFLTEEEGGRATEDSPVPNIRPNSDGYLAQRVELPIQLPEPQAEEEVLEPPYEGDEDETT